MSTYPFVSNDAVNYRTYSAKSIDEFGTFVVSGRMVTITKLALVVVIVICCKL
jgi:hypothetical protein